MDSTYRSDLAFPLSLVADPGVQNRIIIPLGRVLDFARHEPGIHPTRQVALALRPLLAVALSAAGLCQDPPPDPPAADRSTVAGTPASSLAARKGRRMHPAHHAHPPQPPQHGPTDQLADLRPGDPEILFTALSSLIEVVKSLTPGTGRMYAHLGHEALPGRGREEDTATALAPRSEVVIELVSVANSLRDEAGAAPQGASGALPFELAVVAAIVESRGGQLSLASDGTHSRTFVVRLPVHRAIEGSG
jgi:hypothetical protein